MSKIVVVPGEMRRCRLMGKARQRVTRGYLDPRLAASRSTATYSSRRRSRKLPKVIAPTTQITQ
jgi:hypothetical protein